MHWNFLSAIRCLSDEKKCNSVVQYDMSEKNSNCLNAIEYLGEHNFFLAT